MRDPYSVLSVAKDADEKQVKSAFRRLAKRYHPDRNKEDPKAKEKFSEVNHAYEILGDKEKRAQFDRGEIDAEGKSRMSGFEGFSQRQGSPFAGFEFRSSRGGQGFGQSANPFGGDGAEDLLKDIFGNAFATGGPRAQRRAMMPDTEVRANVSVEDLARGKASVYMPDGRQLSFSLPAEAHDGQVVRLAGQGNKQPGFVPGDALVGLRILPHERFQVSGATLRMKAPLPLAIAVIGGRWAVETLDGRVSLNVPAWTGSGKTFRLKGKGLPKKGGGHGDLLVEAMIELPDEHRSELEALMRKAAKQS